MHLQLFPFLTASSLPRTSLSLSFCLGCPSRVLLWYSCSCMIEMQKREMQGPRSSCFLPLVPFHLHTPFFPSPLPPSSFLLSSALPFTLTLSGRCLLLGLRLRHIFIRWFTYWSCNHYLVSGQLGHENEGKEGRILVSFCSCTSLHVTACPRSAVEVHWGNSKRFSTHSNDFLAFTVEF